MTDRVPDHAPGHVRVAVIGSGFAGLAMAIALEERGADYAVLERATDVGGTWRDNTYPGCQCDVPSHLYSFSFAPNPEWSRTYSYQSEIEDYLRSCAERFRVMNRIRFGHDVTDACWDDRAQRWVIQTSAGPLTAEVLVTGNGALSEPAVPAIAGLERFRGAVFHSAQWRRDHDLSGQRVAVVGTGASAIQIVPRIQPEVGSLHLFQRTPAWVLPHTDRPVTRFERWLYRRVPAAQRLVRNGIYWAREAMVVGMAKDPRRLRPIERLARLHLRRQVKDRELRRKLTPCYSPGCKRLLLSNTFYPALTADNAEVIPEALVEVRPTSVVSAGGQEREVDAIVLATGFRVTDNPIAERLRRSDGRSVAEVWGETGPQAHRGTTVSGFPNLFMMTGPNTGIGHTSLVYMIEAQVAYVLDCLATMERRGLAAVDVRKEALEAFNAEVQAKMGRTVWQMGGCASWYTDSHGRNSTLWPDYTRRFRRLTSRFDAENYELVERHPADTEHAPALAGSSR